MGPDVPAKRPVGRPRLPPGMAQTGQQRSAKHNAKRKAMIEKLRAIEAVVAAGMQKTDGGS